jgi:S1-C subfamily serine protease
VPAEGTGSGSILDQNGHILTNYHVVEGAQEISVTLHDGQSYDARLIGFDPPNDVAVLRINAPAEELVPMDLGDSTRLKVGQIVYAIGNPFGLERTMTTGIISSLNRSLPTKGNRTMKSIIQIDAALNRGNSGGPLLNSRGLLIGMNTAIASNTGENTGVGFAIPAGTIQRVVPQLIEKGRVIRPTAGIVHTHPTEAGLVVAALLPGGPAEQAGLRGFRVLRQQRQRGAFLYERTVVDRGYADCIVAAEGQPVHTFDELLTLVEEKQPGDPLVLTVLREGQEAEITLRLGVEE